MSRILVTGGRSGLGLAICMALRKQNHHVVPWDRKSGQDVLCPPEPGTAGWRAGLDVLINCAGVNDIDWLENFTEDRWDRIMDTNAKGIYMMTRALLPLLIESKGTILNIVSNASHVPMTNSLAYNASKGAAHIMTLQLARELRGKVTVFGISPNKLANTGMSAYIDERVPEVRGWTYEQAKQYQLNALLAGEETPPELIADLVAYLLESKDRHRFLTGCIIPYGA